jgi:Na+/melibiose symporter-like transporter
MASMLTDVVEEAELRTGRRSEGIFFAAQTFARKSVTGLGVMLAGGILALVGFPAGAERADIAPAVVRNLGMVYAPIVLVLYMVGISVLRFYAIDRERHRANLARLAASAVQGRQGPAASTQLLPPT